jgi:thiol:disulfide interchange protein DsbA
MLAGCGSKQESGSGPGGQKNGAPAAAPAAASSSPTPVAAEAITKAAVSAEGESVSNDSFSVSPIARAVAATTGDAGAKIPAKWVEGKNYDSIVPAQPVNTGPDKVEIIEVFWYGCPHCYHLEPALDAWRKKGKAPYVQFSRMPVVWSGDEVKRAHARLYFVLEALGKAQSLNDAVFKEIHENGNPLVGGYEGKTEELQKAFLLAHGVSAADFEQNYRSLAVETKLQQAEQYTQRYRVVSVPRMIVAGKYGADVATAGGEDDLFSLLNDLASAEHHH